MLDAYYFLELGFVLHGAVEDEKVVATLAALSCYSLASVHYIEG